VFIVFSREVEQVTGVVASLKGEIARGAFHRVDRNKEPFHQCLYQSMCQSDQLRKSSPQVLAAELVDVPIVLFAECARLY